MLHVSLTFKREYTLDLFFKIIINNLDYRNKGYSLCFLLHNYATFNFLYKHSLSKSSTWHAELPNLTR